MARGKFNVLFVFVCCLQVCHGMPHGMPPQYRLSLFHMHEGGFLQVVMLNVCHADYKSWSHLQEWFCASCYVECLPCRLRG